VLEVRLTKDKDGTLRGFVRDLRTGRVERIPGGKPSQALKDGLAEAIRKIAAEADLPGRP
jgi:hypothetical protein